MSRTHLRSPPWPAHLDSHAVSRTVGRPIVNGSADDAHWEVVVLKQAALQELFKTQRRRFPPSRVHLFAFVPFALLVSAPMAVSSRARAPLRAAASALRRGLASAVQESSAGGVPVCVHNPDGKHRVIVTKDLPGSRWMDILTAANCRVEARALSCSYAPFLALRCR